MAPIKEQFYEYLRSNYIRQSRERLDYVMGLYFRGLILSDRAVLEVGAGPGYFLVWCVINGASKVVGIEPEAAGSTEHVGDTFREMADRIGLTTEVVEYSTDTLDEFVRAYMGEGFDYILMHAVINHLDEEATRKLHLPRAVSERERYIDIFKKMNRLLKSEGIILISDVGRHNFWNDLKLKNPFSPTIEYDKHQQPRLWRELLEESGFKYLDVLWYPFFQLRALRHLLSWRLPAYLTSSAFILRCQKTSYQNDKVS